MGATDVRRRISDYQAYFQLVLALEPSEAGTRNASIRAVLNASTEFLKSASTRELQTRGRELETLITGAIHKMRRRYRPKRDPRLIGRDFKRVATERGDIWRNGVEYGWLADNFDPSALRLPADLPAHARVGLAHHSGYVSLEEVYLIEDAFLLLVTARDAYEQMWSVRRTISEPTSVEQSHDIHRRLTSLNMNVATFARLGVVMAAAFVEAFVNSVGTNEAYRSPTRPAEELELLRGFKKGRFLSLEFKLEKYPALLRSDRKSPIVISDEKQRREPFARFLAETKEVRDASMHFGPSKAAIVCPPKEWLERVDKGVEDAVGVAVDFWKACYPARGLPEYLYGLDQHRFLEAAKHRFLASLESRASSAEQAT